jgi:hypothetical protein
MLLYNFEYYKSYPPKKNNLVLEICKKRDTEGLVCHSSFGLIISSKIESLIYIFH